MPHLEPLAELFRLAFLRGAECEAELRGGASVLTSAEDAEDAWQLAVQEARAAADEPEPRQ